MILKKIHFGDGVKIGSVVGYPAPDAPSLLSRKSGLLRGFSHRREAKSMKVLEPVSISVVLPGRENKKARSASGPFENCYITAG